MNAPRKWIVIECCGVAVSLLLGLGLREFSMHPSSLLEIKHLVNNSDSEMLEKLARRAIRGAMRSDIEKIIDRMNQIEA